MMVVMVVAVACLKCLSSTCLFVYLFILESQKDKIKMIIKI